MKKFRLAAAVSVAVLTMSVQAMAAPLNCNISFGSCPTSNGTVKGAQNLNSTQNNCLNSANLESILSQLNCNNGSSVKGASNLKGIVITKNGINCTPNIKCTPGSKATAGTKCNTGNTCTGPNCTTGSNNGSGNNGSSNNGSGNNGSGNNGSSNNGSGNNGSGNNSSTDTTATVSVNAQKVVDLVNAERAKAGLGALTIDTKVTAAAQVRAKEVQTSFSHTRPDGRSCFTALDEANASYRGAGENIALGQKTPEQVMNDWMNSEGHRANIMNPNFKYIGVGVDGNAWTQLFTY
ncbi:MAG: CAP domain-containing protein [Anaerotignum propionicum]|uniref:CAP domain-containing protein n=1 Tax=Anaerotignum propionicum TaxID=28446 RepID=UPI002B20E530|nr:CAP domain-containing protein [Anaerotignum propionicum]MEA5058166.1 CAP domain-containing protein [Anaerotignum propionicum]